MLARTILSAIFYVLFVGQTVILAILVAIVGVIARGRSELGMRLGRYWGNSNLWLLRHLMGIRTDVTGGENIPDGPCIVAAKHQSDWDIFAILPHTTRPAFIAKKQLMDIPVFGQAAASIDTITIDRALGAEAIPKMLEDTARALGRGCQVVIFPEGTRKKALEPPDYRQGILRMYEALNVPVVPVALNSGLYWGKLSFALWPGTAKARILPPIPPGLGAEAFRRRLIETIEGESNRLIAEAIRGGLSRPVPEDWADKVEAIERGEEPHSPPLPLAAPTASATTY